MDKVNVAAAAGRLADSWRPQVIGRINDHEVKIARFHGQFVWHHHEEADELLLAVNGRFRVEFEDRTVEVEPGEFVIVPRGAEHRTSAEGDADVLIFEPSGVRNTGNVEHPRLTAPPPPDRSR